ncbi:MAG: LAGLIDADG family homing endonuclease [Patescibacteria group bacterium]
MKSGRKRLCRVNCDWSADLAYVIGLIASDGNLSPDGRHISITSKDPDLVMTAKRILALPSSIGTKARGGSKEKKYFVLQFSDVHFFEFLLSIGLTPAKSKTLGVVSVPSLYFIDFFRGCIDGDGSIGSYRHPESGLPQIRLRLCAASLPFLEWMLHTLRDSFPLSGGALYSSKDRSMHFLSFGKSDSLILLRLMYHADSVPALERKRSIAIRLLGE